MEKEYVLGVYKGVIVKQRLYHNHRVRDGFRVDNVQSELENVFLLMNSRKWREKK